LKPETILFIAYSGPCPTLDGKRQRTFALLQALSSQYQVDFLIIDNESDFQFAQKQFSSESVLFLHFTTETGIWEKIKHKIGFVFPHSLKLNQYIQSLCSQTDYAFVFSRYIQPVSHISENQKIIADIDDDFVEQYQSRIRNAKSIYQKLRLFQIYNLNRWFYKRLLGKLDLAILVKEDRNLPKSIILPNLPFQLMLDQNIEFQENRSDAILFVGKLTYKPNLEGIKWFIKEVLPRIQQSNPYASLTIVSNLAAEEGEFLELVRNNNSIRVKINVQNLPATYHSHALAIAPVFQGAGSNIKVIEALMMGKPVITTIFGAKGFENMVKEKLIFCVDSAEAFALKVVELLEIKEGLPVVQKRAFDFFQTNYSLEKWNEKLLVEIDKILVAKILDNQINKK
jgi:polysaccharide biosynthesis protein PslH